MPTTQGIFRISFTEVEAGYHEGYRHGGPEVKRVCDVRWNDSFKFLRDMLGWTQYVSGRTLERHLPDKLFSYRDTFGRETMWAAEAQLVDTLGVHDIDAATEESRWLDRVPADPVPPVGQEVFGLMRYEVTYRPRTYQVLPDAQVTHEMGRYITTTRTYSTYNVTVTGNTLKFVNARPGTSGLIPENLTMTLFVTQHTYVWHQVPAARNGQPPGALRQHFQACTGRVNAAAFDNNQFPPETLLCLAPHEERYHDAHGDLVFDFHFSFLEQPQIGPDFGWNTTYSRTNPATGANAPGFYSIIGADNQTKLYKTADLDSLFELD